MSIPGELERARHLSFAADETAAKELLLSLMPQIEEADRDDWMLEVYAQLGEIYLVRTAYDGVREALHRIRECLGTYSSVLAGTAAPDIVAAAPTSTADIQHLICRYSRRAQFLDAGMAAALGDHEGAATALQALDDMAAGDWAEPAFADLTDEHRYLRTFARIFCALGLCDDDLHVHSVPLWQNVIDEIETVRGTDEASDYLRVLGSIGYARFCIETGRLDRAEPWLQRAGARAEARGWELATARAKLERGAASWAAGDHATTERLMYEAYPVIAKYARAHDVSRCWLYFGLWRMEAGGLKEADECWENAERHWRELGKPLHIHRILLQRSWIAIFRGRYRDAEGAVAQARACLDSSPRSSWVAYARLDDHLGTVLRAEALADLGFDGAGDPAEAWKAADARYGAGLGVTRAEPDTPRYRDAMVKLERAAELKVPASLAVDSVRYSVADAEARAQWATCISAPLLAGAFAVAWEWENPELVSELIEYHCARGSFTTDGTSVAPVEWSRVGTAQAPIVDVDELALVAAAPLVTDGPGLTRLGPLPPLQMDPTSGPVLDHYRELALHRYGQCVTAAESAWATWP